MAWSLVDTLGLQKGSKVIIFTSNLYESLVVTLACARAGFIHFNVDAGHSTEELANQINYFKPHAMFVMSHIINETDKTVKVTH